MSVTVNDEVPAAGEIQFKKPLTTEAAVHGARVHGIDSIGVLWGYGTDAELSLAGATALAATPDDVVALLTGRVTDGCSRALA